MKRRGLNQRQFAALIGRSEVSVSRWVTGRRLPRRHDILEIERVTAGAVRPGDWYPSVEAAE